MLGLYSWDDIMVRKKKKEEIVNLLFLEKGRGFSVVN